MTYKQALEHIEHIIQLGQTIGSNTGTPLDMYTLCAKALEKQIPKKAREEQYFYGYEWYCPSCNKFLGFNNQHPKHCVECGQIIDWSKEV